MATAGALDVVGVDGPTVDRGDRVRQLGRLVQAVGVQRDADIVRVRICQDAVDQLRVRAVVLVDLEPHGARAEQGVQGVVGGSAGVRLQPDVDRPVLE